MYLWVLRRDISDVGYDENAGFVVFAETASRAREVAFDASKEKGDESSGVWLHSGITTIEVIGEALLKPDSTEREAGVVMREFNAG